MNKYAWLILFLFFIWGVVSWNWYTCGIKGFCDDDVQTAEVAPVEVEREFGFAPTEEVSVPVEAVTVPVAAAPVPAKCNAYLTQYIKFGEVNDPTEVQKLKRFLVADQGVNLPDLSGTYDVATMNAVMDFQNKYRDDVLVGAWGIAEATGFVYKSTLAKINELQCQTQSN